MDDVCTTAEGSFVDPMLGEQELAYMCATLIDQNRDLKQRLSRATHRVQSLEDALNMRSAMVAEESDENVPMRATYAASPRVGTVLR